MSRSAALTGAVAGALAVALGAFGAHALRDKLDTATLQLWHTAVDYQFWHALVLLNVALAPPSRWRTFGGAAFAAGIATFCGSLYGLALGAHFLIGMITPVGGFLLILGWICVDAMFWRTAK